jgi:UTP--glucose-1-phosphate uridylyltransferase
MNIRIETAVLPLAGTGTREFPITTAIDKAMMPIYAGKQSRPLVDYMVEDCASAGLKRIIFVTTERGKVQLQSYFEPGHLDSYIQQQLENQGKTELLLAEQERRNKYGVQYEYIIQSPEDGYGTTVPLYLARAALQGEQRFALMGGDDFVYHQDVTSELGLALKTWDDSGADHVIMGLPVPRDEGPKYGILQTNARGQLTAWDERPPLARVPEHPVANISRYLLSDVIWESVEQEMQQQRDGEHYITYPVLAALADGQSFQLHEVTGQYLDGGSFEGLLAASEYVTANPRNS